MTKEEAMDRLKEARAGHKEFLSVEALNMAIKALEQSYNSIKTELKPCEDAISRRAVIDGINRYFHDEYYQRTSIQDCRDCLIEDVINKLPAVNPQPKWIPVSERLPENSGNYLITYCLQDEIETQEAVYVKEEDKWFDITDIEITLAVIAWMPLPKPYESQERSDKE